MSNKSPVTPTRRDLQFKPPADRVHDWSDGSVHHSMLMNGMSLVIPVGERFFIDAVRHYRDRITDPELKQAATAFIGQEAMHGREHDDYNDLMCERVLSARPFEKRVKALLDRFQKRAPASTQLAITISLEHLTAIMAHGYLSTPHMTDKSETRFGALWQWHALEETEHKAVAFDVYQAMVGKGPRAYVERTSVHVVSTAIFWSMLIPAFVEFVKDEGKLADIKGWREFLRVNFGEVGFLRKMIRPWFSYFRPGFHPWDHDNSHFLEQIAEIESRYGKALATAA